MPIKQIERIFLHLINAWMFLFAGFTTGFMITYSQIESGIPWVAMVVALAGLVLWWVYRTKLLELLLCSSIYQIGVNGFYMVGLFGLFMGVPVFNILPGIGLAYISGLNARREGTPADVFHRKLRWMNRVTLVILCAFLLASATIALVDPYTGGSLQGMLGLTGEVTRVQIILIIVFGGLSLIAAQWLLERLVGQWAFAMKV